MLQVKARGTVCQSIWLFTVHGHDEDLYDLDANKLGLLFFSPISWCGHSNQGKRRGPKVHSKYNGDTQCALNRIVPIFCVMECRYTEAKRTAKMERF